MVLSLTARGMTSGEIVAHLQEVYGMKTSKETISTITEVIPAAVAALCERVEHTPAARRTGGAEHGPAAGSRHPRPRRAPGPPARPRPAYCHSGRLPGPRRAPRRPPCTPPPPRTKAGGARGLPRRPRPRSRWPWQPPVRGRTPGSSPPGRYPPGPPRLLPDR
ncbi:transposase [Streptomyces sp. NPDC015032]|uniref:transposase n=1 Tax=Streptomyces sp. NPDC015032 TaxID=3364937 RepID=UPI0036FEC07B